MDQATSGDSAALDVFGAERFGEFELIGEGQHAQVFCAYDHQLGREVALKVAIQDTLIDDLGGVEALDELGLTKPLQAYVGALDWGVVANYTLLREARLLATVDVPGVVTVLEVGRFERGAVAVIMPLLHKSGHRHSAPWRVLLEGVVQLAEGLAMLHAAGVIHRDLKPDNILYDRALRPCIADLGLACRLDDHEAMSHIAGSRAWMAPEVLTHGRCSVQTDLYGFCMIAFAILYGHAPFSDEAAKLAGDITQLARADAMPPSVRQALARGLAPDPAERWSSMPELLLALREPPPAPQTKPWKQAKRWSLALAGLAAASGVVAGLWAATPTAQAAACDEVSGELADVWNPQVQAELRRALGTRRAGQELETFASRWIAVRAQECEAAKRENRPPVASPCSVGVRDHLNITITILRTPFKRKGIEFEQVLAELPEPEHCLEHPEDADFGGGGLLELRRLDVEVGLLLASDALDSAEQRQTQYMLAAIDLWAQYDIARAIYWRAKLYLRRGELNRAEADFRRVYAEAQELGAVDLGGDAMLELAQIAGTRGDLTALDGWAFVARTTLGDRRPDKLGRLLEVQGLALVEGDSVELGRGLALLREGVDLREGQYRRFGGSREKVGRSLEALARGLLAAGHGDEALEVALESLAIHEAEYGGLTERAHALRRLVFVAQATTGRLDDAYQTGELLLYRHNTARDWPAFINDALWMSAAYSDANNISYASQLLKRARHVASTHGFDDLTRIVDDELGAVSSGLDQFTRQGK